MRLRERPVDRWTETTELLAQLNDRITTLIKVVGVAWLKDFELDVEANRVPRPGADRPTARRQSTKAELAAFLRKAGAPVRYSPPPT